MRAFMTLFCTAALSVCFAGNQPHEFEGVSEIYNIRNLRMLAKFLPENPVIMEAGAFEGRDTQKLAERFPNGRIFAFEPLTNHFSALETVMKPYANVSVHNAALDIISGKGDFYVCHGTNAQYPVYEFHSSLLRPTGSQTVHLLGPVETVTRISLKDFCRDTNIEKVDMLWLSTEGSERQILEGAQDLLSNVTLVYARTNLYPERESITLFSDLKSFMEAHGFILLSHFYMSADIHGDALFIKKQKF